LTAHALFYSEDGVLRAPWRLVGYVAVLVATMVVLTWLAIPILRALHVTPARSPVAVPFVNFCLLLAAIWFAHLVMLRWVDRLPWSYVGLGRSQASAGRVVAGLALGGLGIAVPSLGLLGVHWLTAVPAGPGSWLVYAAMMAGFFLPQSLAEEMMVRGYPFAVLRDALGWPWALALTSALFGALHLLNPGVDAQSVILVTLAGVFLGGVLLLTESLYAAWMAHFAWNWAMAALLHTAVSGLSTGAPDYHVVDTGPDWATGGVWGPEGGAGAALGMIVGLLALAVWRRRRAAQSTQPEHSGPWLNA
jgi:membrane protease YdiL (CAAX protease family)